MKESEGGNTGTVLGGGNTISIVLGQCIVAKQRRRPKCLFTNPGGTRKFP